MFIFGSTVLNFDVTPHFSLTAFDEECRCFVVFNGEVPSRVFVRN